MATGWLRGVVKEVPSGDTVVIAGNVKSGPPPEMRITLSSLVCPRMGRRDGTTRDEPFAWASREFLRKKVIGQQVTFKVDYTVEAIGNRPFGSVFLGEKDNVALSVVAAGWCKVRSQGKEQSPYIEDLKKAEEAATLAGRGMWTKDEAELATAIRDGSDDFDASIFMAETGKGTVVQAVVEGVMNGSMMRVTMLPSGQTATIQVCGAQCPSMGRRAPGATGEDGAPAPAAGVPTSAAAVAAMAPVVGASAAEPFAREAKHMAETRCLNREVTLIVEGVDKYNNLFATVMAPGADGEKESLAEALLKAGFAKVMDFSANMVSGGGQKLRDLERAAKLEKRALWTNYVPQASNSAKATDAFKGTVIEVVSGDCVVVKDEASRMERRVQISSLRAPRMSTRDRAADPWATEAKDFLRKKLIGQMVEVKMEYVRKLSSMGDSHGAPEREMAFGNVEVVPEKGEEKQNVGEMVVARGFAAVVRHRADEERSGVYDKLLECEELAKGAKRGVHGTKAPPPNRINDVSIPGSAAKAKQYLPFFQRGKLQASVEFVLSGHRLKLSIPKESAIITFAPSGIRTPSRAQPAGGGRPAVSGEPYADEAISFTRELCMQRDCEVSIETMDRGGGFLGTVSVSTAKGGQLDLALVLVKAGLARIQPGMDASMLTNGHALMEAQAAAQAARLKIWEKWSPEEAPVSADDSGAAGGSSGAPAEVLEVVVTEVEAADEFYIQVPTEPRLRWVCEQLAAVSDEDAPAIPPLLRAGQLCLGQFSLDNQWYRSYVERANTGKDTTYDVFFIDYGNRERLPASRVRTIDTALAAVPPQARQACLAYVRVPEPGAEHGPEARVCLAQLLGGGQALLAHVVSREAIPAGPGGKHPKNAGGKLHVQLLDADGGADVAAELLASGYATLPKLSKLRTAAAKAAVEKLQEFEEEARSARRGVFVYGDPGDSDDEAAAAPAKPVGAWGAKR